MIALAWLALALAAPPGDTVVVGPGVYRPMFPPSPEEAEIPVPAFRLDVTPVTNAAFLAFVTAHPEWRRDQISRLYADTGYLSTWDGPTTLGDRSPADAPVVRVSWFAARAYCKADGGALPTNAQWEMAAAASDTVFDARRDPAFVQQILEWYSKPTPERRPAVGQTPPNAWGVRDLHGLVWEWTLDFDTELVTADARDQDDPDKLLFCGTGAVGSADPADYAAFMRTSMRSSLVAADTTNGLGFRCARPLETR